MMKMWLLKILLFLTLLLVKRKRSMVSMNKTKKTRSLKSLEPYNVDPMGDVIITPRTYGID